MIDISIPFTLMLFLWGYCGFKIIKLRRQGKKLTLRICTSAVLPEAVLGYDMIKESMHRYTK